MAIFFVNYKQQRVVLGDDALEHISEVHSEITLEFIKMTLEDPDEVRSSSYQVNSELYYLKRTSRRYICVVVKVCRDGNFISTAMTTTQPKVGRVLYKKVK